MRQRARDHESYMQGYNDALAFASAALRETLKNEIENMPADLEIPIGEAGRWLRDIADRIDSLRGVPSSGQGRLKP